MNLTITPQAMDWFKREIALEKGMGVQFLEKSMAKRMSMKAFQLGFL